MDGLVLPLLPAENGGDVRCSGDGAAHRYLTVGTTFVALSESNRKQQSVTVRSCLATAFEVTAVSQLSETAIVLFGRSQLQLCCIADDGKSFDRLCLHKATIMGKSFPGEAASCCSLSPCGRYLAVAAGARARITDLSTARGPLRVHTLTLSSAVVVLDWAPGVAVLPAELATDLSASGSGISIRHAPQQQQELAATPRLLAVCNDGSLVVLRRRRGSAARDAFVCEASRPREGGEAGSRVHAACWLRPRLLHDRGAAVAAVVKATFVGTAAAGASTRSRCCGACTSSSASSESPTRSLLPIGCQLRLLRQPCAAANFSGAVIPLEGGAFEVAQLGSGASPTPGTSASLPLAATAAAPSAEAASSDSPCNCNLLCGGPTTASGRGGSAQTASAGTRVGVGPVVDADTDAVGLAVGIDAEVEVEDDADDDEEHDAGTSEGRGRPRLDVAGGAADTGLSTGTPGHISGLYDGGDCSDTDDALVPAGCQFSGFIVSVMAATAEHGGVAVSPAEAERLLLTLWGLRAGSGSGSSPPASSARLDVLASAPLPSACRIYAATASTSPSHRASVALGAASSVVLVTGDDAPARRSLPSTLSGSAAYDSCTPSAASASWADALALTAATRAVISPRISADNATTGPGAGASSIKIGPTPDMVDLQQPSEAALKHIAAAAAWDRWVPLAAETTGSSSGIALQRRRGALALVAGGLAPSLLHSDSSAGGLSTTSSVLPLVIPSTGPLAAAAAAAASALPTQLVVSLAGVGGSGGRSTVLWRVLPAADSESSVQLLLLGNSDSTGPSSELDDDTAGSCNSRSDYRTLRSAGDQLALLFTAGGEHLLPAVLDALAAHGAGAARLQQAAFAAAAAADNDEPGAGSHRIDHGSDSGAGNMLSAPAASLCWCSSATAAASPPTSSLPRPLPLLDFAKLPQLPSTVAGASSAAGSASGGGSGSGTAAGGGGGGRRKPKRDILFDDFDSGFSSFTAAAAESSAADVSASSAADAPAAASGPASVTGTESLGLQLSAYQAFCLSELLQAGVGLPPLLQQSVATALPDATSAVAPGRCLCWRGDCSCSQLSLLLGKSTAPQSQAYPAAVATGIATATATAPFAALDAPARQAVFAALRCGIATLAQRSASGEEDAPGGPARDALGGGPAAITAVAAAAEPALPSLPWLAVAWALLSSTQGPLLECLIAHAAAPLGWRLFTALRVSLWLRSPAALQAIVERIAKAEYAGSGKDPFAAVLPYLLLGLEHLPVLRSLFRLSPSPGHAKVGVFLHNDFAAERWRRAASKNAYALLGQHRYAAAAGFFLLAGRPSLAIKAAAVQAGSLAIAMAIARLWGTAGEREVAPPLKPGQLRAVAAKGAAAIADAEPADAESDVSPAAPAPMPVGGLGGQPDIATPRLPTAEVAARAAAAVRVLLAGNASATGLVSASQPAPGELRSVCGTTFAAPSPSATAGITAPAPAAAAAPRAGPRIAGLGGGGGAGAGGRRGFGFGFDDEMDSGGGGGGSSLLGGGLLGSGSSLLGGGLLGSGRGLMGSNSLLGSDRDALPTAAGSRFGSSSLLGSDAPESAGLDADGSPMLPAAASAAGIARPELIPVPSTPQEQAQLLHAVEGSVWPPVPAPAAKDKVGLEESMSLPLHLPRIDTPPIAVDPVGHLIVNEILYPPPVALAVASGASAAAAAAPTAVDAQAEAADAEFVARLLLGRRLEAMQLAGSEAIHALTSSNWVGEAAVAPLSAPAMQRAAQLAQLLPLLQAEDATSIGVAVASSDRLRLLLHSMSLLARQAGNGGALSPAMLHTRADEGSGLLRRVSRVVCGAALSAALSHSASSDCSSCPPVAAAASLAALQMLRSEDVSSSAGRADRAPTAASLAALLDERSQHMRRQCARLCAAALGGLSERAAELAADACFALSKCSGVADHAAAVSAVHAGARARLESEWTAAAAAAGSSSVEAFVALCEEPPLKANAADAGTGAVAAAFDFSSIAGPVKTADAAPHGMLQRHLLKRGCLLAACLLDAPASQVAHSLPSVMRGFPSPAPAAALLWRCLRLLRSQSDSSHDAAHGPSAAEAALLHRLHTMAACAAACAAADEVSRSLTASSRAQFVLELSRGDTAASAAVLVLAAFVEQQLHHDGTVPAAGSVDVFTGGASEAGEAGSTGSLLEALCARQLWRAADEPSERTALTEAPAPQLEAVAAALRACVGGAACRVLGAVLGPGADAVAATEADAQVRSLARVLEREQRAALKQLLRCAWNRNLMAAGANRGTGLPSRSGVRAPSGRRHSAELLSLVPVGVSSVLQQLGVFRQLQLLQVWAAARGAAAARARDCAHVPVPRAAMSTALSGAFAPAAAADASSPLRPAGGPSMRGCAMVALHSGAAAARQPMLLLAVEHVGVQHCPLPSSASAASSLLQLHLWPSDRFDFSLPFTLCPDSLAAHPLRPAYVRAGPEGVLAIVSVALEPLRLPGSPRPAAKTAARTAAGGGAGEASPPAAAADPQLPLQVVHRLERLLTYAALPDKYHHSHAHDHHDAVTVHGRVAGSGSHGPASSDVSGDRDKGYRSMFAGLVGAAHSGVGSGSSGSGGGGRAAGLPHVGSAPASLNEMAQTKAKAQSHAHAAAAVAPHPGPESALSHAAASAAAPISTAPTVTRKGSPSPEAAAVAAAAAPTAANASARTKAMLTATAAPAAPASGSGFGLSSGLAAGLGKLAHGLGSSFSGLSGLGHSLGLSLSFGIGPGSGSGSGSEARHATAAPPATAAATAPAPVAPMTVDGARTEASSAASRAPARVGVGPAPAPTAPPSAAAVGVPAAKGGASASGGVAVAAPAAATAAAAAAPAAPTAASSRIDTSGSHGHGHAAVKQPSRLGLGGSGLGRGHGHGHGHGLGHGHHESVSTGREGHRVDLSAPLDEQITRVRYSPDGSAVLACFASGVVRVWAADAGGASGGASGEPAAVLSTSAAHLLLPDDEGSDGTSRSFGAGSSWASGLSLGRGHGGAGGAGHSRAGRSETVVAAAASFSMPTLRPVWAATDAVSIDGSGRVLAAACAPILPFDAAGGGGAGGAHAADAAGAGRTAAMPRHGSESALAAAASASAGGLAAGAGAGFGFGLPGWGLHIFDLRAPPPPPSGAAGRAARAGAGGGRRGSGAGGGATALHLGASSLHFSGCTSLLHDPLSQCLVAGCEDGALLLFDLRRMRERVLVPAVPTRAAASFTRHQPSGSAPAVASAVAGPGSRGATAGAATQSPLPGSLSISGEWGHAGAVTALALHPSCRFVASGGQDGCVRLWSLPELEVSHEVHRLHRQHGAGFSGVSGSWARLSGVSDLHFSGNDASSLVSSGADGAVHMTELPL